MNPDYRGWNDSLRNYNPVRTVCIVVILLDLFEEVGTAVPTSVGFFFVGARGSSGTSIPRR